MTEDKMPTRTEIQNALRILTKVMPQYGKICFSGGDIVSKDKGLPMRTQELADEIYLENELTMADVREILGTPDFYDDLREIPGTVDGVKDPCPGLLYGGTYYILLVVHAEFDSGIAYDVLLENHEYYFDTLEKAERKLAEYVRSCG